MRVIPAASRSVFLACALAVLVPRLATAQFLERVSVSSSGAQANGASFLPALSPDARFVAFVSAASNLVPNDANGTVADCFLRDRQAGTTVLVSIGNAGQQATQISHTRAPHVSADGRYVLFLSNQLDPLDTDANVDVYLRDVVAGTTTWISQLNDNSVYFGIGMSADGNRVMDEHFGSSSYSSLAVVDRASGQVWVFNGGLTPPAVLQSFSNCVLASDGASIVYRRNATSLGSSWQYGRTWLMRLDLVANTSEVLLAGEFNAEPLNVSADGRYLLYTEARASLWRLDRVTLQREQVDVGELPPAWFPMDGIESAAISDTGEYVAFSTDNPSILAGDLTPGSEAYVRVLPIAGTLRASVNLAGQQSNGEEGHVDISGDGTVIAFDSDATNLIAGDSNSASDVFVRSVCGPFFPDADADGFGDASAAAQPMCVPAPSGLVLNAVDCNDANPAIHPGVIELCDGVDQDCDNRIDEDVNGLVYCGGVPSGVWSCEPAISTSGCPSASAPSGYTLQVDALPGQRTATFFYGTSLAFLPWAPLNASTMCVAAPRQRTTLQRSGGNPNGCYGQLTLDFQAWAAAHPGALALPLAAGQMLFFQAWYSDALAIGGSRLTPAIMVVLDP